MGVREEAGTLNTSASTASTELDWVNSMLSAKSEEVAKQASVSGMRAEKLAGDTWEKS